MPLFGSYFQMGDIIMIKKRGFTLLEITIVLGIGSLIGFMKFQDMRKEQEAVMAQAVGFQMKQVGEAVNRYISIRYNKLSTLSSSRSQSSDPGPRTCTANGCEITYQTLVNESLLPSTYAGVNAQKSSYKILLKRSGVSPNYVINGLIATTIPWVEGGKTRYDLLGKSMQSAGIDSGMTKSPAQASGYNGVWTEKSTDYPAINKAGLLVYRVGYDSSMYSVYLRRDGTLPMTGNLNMGTNDINNAKNITASGTGIFGGDVSSAGKIIAAQEIIAHNGYGDAIHFGGDAVNNDYEITMSKDKTLSIHMASNRTDLTTLKISGGLSTIGNGTISGTLDTGKSITSGGQFNGHNGGGDSFSIGGGDANDYEFRLDTVKPLTIWRNGGTSTETRLQVFGKQTNQGDFAITPGTGSTGSIAASGNIQGHTLQPTWLC